MGAGRFRRFGFLNMKLEERILNTLAWFEVQQLTPTLLELHKFLLPELAPLILAISQSGELNDDNLPFSETVELSSLFQSLRALRLAKKVEFINGYYFLPGRENLVLQREEGYIAFCKREKLIARYVKALQYIPFVKGVALAGSQALGLPKKSSDIDLFIVTAPGWLWLPRTLVTLVLHVLGVRRYGDKIANRFCLNHYVSGHKPLQFGKNLYTASEYAKLRVCFGRPAIASFQEANRQWITFFFSNFAQAVQNEKEDRNFIQYFLEKVLSNSFGTRLEEFLKRIEKPRIRTDEKYVVVEEDELSFHPQSKQGPLLWNFFQSQEQDNRESVELVG